MSFSRAKWKFIPGKGPFPANKTTSSLVKNAIISASSKVLRETAFLSNKNKCEASLLPRITSSSKSPPTHFSALQVTTSINDCLLRSRGHAKYVISSDLDEIVVTSKESSLLKLLDKLQKKFEKSAAFVIRSSFALFEVNVFEEYLSFFASLIFLEINFPSLIFLSQSNRI